MEQKKPNKPTSEIARERENFFSGRFKQVQLPAAPAFLIILMGSLGDVTRGLCLVSLIKNRFPESTVTWLVEPKCEQIVRIHPLIDEVLVFNRTVWIRGGVSDLLRTLKKKRFDCVLDLQRHVKSGFFSFFSGAKYRIGFHPKNAKEMNWFFNNTHIPFMDDDYPKIFHYLKFTEGLGCHPEYMPSQSRDLLRSGALDFGFSGDELVSEAGNLLSRLERPFLAVVLGSSWVSKEWPFEGYANLIRAMIKSSSLDIVMVDTPKKYRMACDLEREIGSTRLINLVGQTSLPELTAVLKKARVAVGPDCGSAHIAAAVGTPYVTLFGPTSAARTAPLGSAHLIVSRGLDCAPCYTKKCPGKNTICMRAITAEEVKTKIFQALEMSES